VLGVAENMSHKEYLQIDNHVLFIKRIGTGDPVLFLHGGPGLFHNYLVQPFKQLSVNHELIFFDQRGSGASSAMNPNQPICINDFVADIESLRQALNFSTITLIGHSWGGLLAALYAAKFEKNLRSMILVDPAPGSSSFDKVGRNTMQNRLTVDDREEINSIMQTNPFENREMDAINRFVQINEKSRYFDQSYVSKNKPTFTFETLTKLQTVSSLLNEELDDYDIYQRIQGLDTKTLVIHGDYDPIPVESSRKYSEMLSNSSFQLLNNCGHFPFIEKKEETLSSIVDFLNS